MKKILIIGLGSIGQRHLRNLNSVDKKISFIACRRKKIVPALNDNLEPDYNLNLTKKYNIQNFTNLKNSLKDKPDAAFICTPSNMHINETIECLKKNIHVFIEKPLGSNNRRLKELINIYKDMALG